MILSLFLVFNINIISILSFIIILFLLVFYYYFIIIL